MMMNSAGTTNVDERSSSSNNNNNFFFTPSSVGDVDGVPFPLLSSALHQNQINSSSSSGSMMIPSPLSKIAKTPKKRSRASRRAPTTVLTTDTSNFRAMVQEFTGVPSPPFSTTSPPPSSSLLKPYPHKYQQVHHYYSGSNSTSTSTSATPTVSPPTAFNYQQLPPSSEPFLNFPHLLGGNNSSLMMMMMRSSALTGDAGHYGQAQQQQAFIGPGWRRDGDGGDPARLRQVNNMTAAGDQGRGGEAGMVESWICSSD